MAVMGTGSEVFRRKESDTPAESIAATTPGMTPLSEPANWSR